MNILVLNGSPKGKYSITLQTILYLEKLFPEHHFEVIHGAQRIKSIERDFAETREKLIQADLLLFSYPVYTFIAPSQLHKFIELMKGEEELFAGKFATQLTTSKRFYDVTAHRYIQDNCQDMGMKFIRGLSADMEDLLTEKGRKEAEDFFRYVTACMEQDSYEPIPEKLPAPAHKPVAVPEESVPAEKGDVVIVTDCEPDNTQLSNMIARFRAKLPRRSRIFHIGEYPFKGGCLGCFGCAVSGKCVHKDNFDEALRKEIQTAECIIYAFTVKDHSMGARFKMYDDRQFCNGHRTVTMGSPVGYLISGDYSREFNLQMILEGRAQVGGNFLAGIATDEHDPDGEIDRLVFALEYALEHKYVPPQNFYGIGGMKIFRDLIWTMQGLMKADHKFFKSHGQYDFPQKKWPTMMKMYLVGGLMSSPKLMAKMGNKMNDGMLMPYKKLFDKMDKEEK